MSFKALLVLTILFAACSHTIALTSSQNWLLTAEARLRYGDFHFFADAMSLHLKELVKYERLTIFAVKDNAAFDGAFSFINLFGRQVIPNLCVYLSDFQGHSGSMIFPTLVPDVKLTVSNGGRQNVVTVDGLQVRSEPLFRSENVIIYGMLEPFPI